MSPSSSTCHQAIKETVTPRELYVKSFNLMLIRKRLFMHKDPRLIMKDNQAVMTNSEEVIVKLSIQPVLNRSHVLWPKGRSYMIDTE